MNFTGVTAVEFNGIAASFNLVSSTSIKAVVPIGAASGSISVTTPTGIATSSGNFTVIPDPANAAPSRNYFTTGTPTLTWNRVTGAETYEIQVATTATFTLPLVFTDTVPATMLTVTIPSLTNGTYYWRVRALNSSTAGAWSVTDSFTVHVP